jgi:hypothetical protein
MIKLDDTQKKYIDSTHYRTLYRTYCDKCGLDRGYLTKDNAINHAMCRKCCHYNMSTETREKMSKAKTGKTSGSKGYKHTAEAKAKMSKAKLGKPAPMKGRYLTLEQRVKLSCVNRGIKVEDFNDFTTELSKVERNKLTSAKLHITCFERDDYTCLKCSIRGGTLNAHHLNSWKHFPEQRFDVNNLVTLCDPCHREFHKIYGNGKATPNTREQYLEFRK